MSVFQAVWPVIGGGQTQEELITEAIEDLPKVARRHGVITVGEPDVMVRLGRDVPGDWPTAVVVVAVSPVAEFQAVLALGTKHSRECERCGLERNARYAPEKAYYCNDCKRFVKADGWLVKAS